MTKTTTYGTMLVIDQGQNYGTGIYNNGSIITQAPTTNYGQFQRRLGESSSLTTYSGIDGRFRPCTHSRTRWDIESKLTDIVWRRYGATSSAPTALKQAEWRGLALQTVRTYYNQYTSRVTAITAPSVNWEAEATNALSVMLPAIGGENSLINFILELKDFKKLVEVLRDRSAGWLDVVKAAFSQKDLDKPLARVSKSYLSYQFAWRPLMGDIVDLFLGLEDLNSRIREVIRRADSPQQRYFGRNLTAESTSVLYNSPVVSPQGGQGFGTYLNPRADVRVFQTTSAVRYHATVRYRYPVPPALRTAAGRAKAQLDALGLNADPSIIWNAIPFSFVIDWFVNVGGFLHGLRIDNIPIQSEILSFCHSVKAHKKVSLQIRTNAQVPGTSSPVGNYADTDVANVSYYDRRVGVPDLRLALLTSGLSPREALLSSALGGSRIRW